MVCTLWFAEIDQRFFMYIFGISVGKNVNRENESILVKVTLGS